MRAIHQLLAGVASHDAITNEARRFRAMFRSWGYASEIFSETRRIGSDLKQETVDISAAARDIGRDDVAILHLSIGSTVNDAFAALPCRKAILYHNMTPARYFTVINASTAALLAKGREQLRRLAGSAEVCMADSGYNAAEMEEAGHRNVRVIPIVLDMNMLRQKPDQGIMHANEDGQVKILFVGRCVPNKRFEDLIDAFHCFNQCVCRKSRLILVGSHVGTERYYYLLLAKARRLNLGEKVFFTGPVRQSELNAYYKSADVFLSMSEHEGYCIPLIESMFHNVPVLAYSAAAVPETMAGTGILFTRKDYESVAEMTGKLVNDRPFRDAVLARQKRRIEEYLGRDLEKEVKTCLEPLLK